MEPKRILSFGGGRQSSCLFLLAKHGKIEPFDLVIFADTGFEPKAVYDHIAKMQQEFGGIETVSIGNIKDDLLRHGRFATMPFYVSSENGGGYAA